MKVKLEMVGNQCTVRSVETGERIEGIHALHVSIKTGSRFAEVACQIYSNEVMAQGQAVFMVADPRIGIPREVRSIEFADGDRVEF